MRALSICRPVLLVAVLSLGCYCFIGRTEAYLVNPDWNLGVRYEPQKFWVDDLSYRKHFCRVENTFGGANAAIRGDETNAKMMNSFLLRYATPNAVRLGRGYQTIPIVLVFFRWHEGVTARPFQRVIQDPNLPACELAGMDGIADKLLEPLISIFIVRGLCRKCNRSHSRQLLYQRCDT